jgi:hypothetical protein
MLAGSEFQMHMFCGKKLKKTKKMSSMVPTKNEPGVNSDACEG